MFLRSFLKNLCTCAVAHIIMRSNKIELAQALGSCSLLPATVVVPLWMVVGSWLLGGVFGLVSLLILIFCAPIAVGVHGSLLALYGRHGNSSENRMTLLSATLLFAYYALQFAFQIFVVDDWSCIDGCYPNSHGQMPKIGSVASIRWGMNQNQSAEIAVWILIAIGFLAAVLLLLGCLSASRNRRDNVSPLASGRDVEGVIEESCNSTPQMSLSSGSDDSYCVPTEGDFSGEIRTKYGSL